MFRLDGKTAIVTGAAMGIGEAIVRAYASQGAHVVAGDIQVEEGRKVVEEVCAEGGSARFVELDVADEASCRSVFEEFQKKEGALDILVNNAGIGVVGTILDTEADMMERIWQVNVMGGYRLTRLFLPSMLERRSGSVIFLASIGGVVGVRDRFAYTTSKFAVVGMVKALALDHSACGVRFHAVCPCRVETSWIRQRVQAYPDPEAAYREMSATQLNGRMARPDEIAAAAVYLASDAAEMVTGSEFIIDGGFSAGK